MAGAYPDPPNHRLAWDRDGALIEFDSGSDVLHERTEADREAANDESTSSSGNSSGGSGGYWIILLPEPATITHYTLVIDDLGGSGVNVPALEVSTDTTNGKDGTWTEVDNPPETTDVSIWRDGWRQITGADGVIGIRYRHGHAQRAAPRCFHLYGTYDTPPPPALALWDPDSDQRISAAYLDWGDVQRGTTATKRFRVKNLSGTDMAEGITLTDEALTDGNPTNTGQHDFSDDDGASFADPLDIGDLSPGEISGELLLHRDMANDAELGIWALRILAQATAWSEVS